MRQIQKSKFYERGTKHQTKMKILSKWCKYLILNFLIIRIKLITVHELCILFKFKYLKHYLQFVRTLLKMFKKRQNLRQVIGSFSAFFNVIYYHFISVQYLVTGIQCLVSSIWCNSILCLVSSSDVLVSCVLCLVSGELVSSVWYLVSGLLVSCVWCHFLVYLYPFFGVQYLVYWYPVSGIQYLVHQYPVSGVIFWCTCILCLVSSNWCTGIQSWCLVSGVLVSCV